MVSPVSQALVPYRSTSSSSTSVKSTTTTPYASRAIVPARLFTAATGTAIITELLYRLLIEVINRVLTSAQTMAARGLDQLTSYFEQRALERRERNLQAKVQAQLPNDIKGDGRGSSGSSGVGGDGGNGRERRGKSVLWEVKKMVGEKGPGGVEFMCPNGGQRPGPPAWVRGVLEGIGEGRMEERDFWIQTHGD